MRVSMVLGASYALICMVVTPMEAKENMNSLSMRDRSVVAIAASVARGDLDRLTSALASALDTGLSVNEAKEVLTQLYAYCGFPRSLNALGRLLALVRERAAAGTHDVQGRLPGPLPSGRSLEYGTANQTRLCGGPVRGELFDFAPAIDEYLKAHLFGDIFGRDNLDWRTREVATIAALAAMSGVESQLRAHLGIGARNGVSEAQGKEILELVRGESGTGAGDGRLVRVSRIEVMPERLEEYLAMVTECGRQSMSLEPGVLLMYSMQDKEHPERITILEIYADRLSYERHVRSPHFQRYKQGTLEMVRRLELLDQTPLLPSMRMK